MIVGSLLCFKNPITQVAYAPPSAFTLIIDKNGYIGSKQPAAGNTYYAYLDKQADFSESGLGQVTIIVPEIGSVEIGGKTYKTTKIGNQTWLAENLDLKIEGFTPGVWDTTKTSFMYQNNDENTYGWNGLKCGLLYNGYAVDYLELNKVNLFNGWHIPSLNDIETLRSYIGINNGAIYIKAKDKSINSNWPNNWRGADSFSFSALPSGSSFGYIDRVFDMWASTKYSNTSFYGIELWNDKDSVSIYGFFGIANGYSIRLIKDI